jgi:hypothetical protein
MVNLSENPVWTNVTRVEPETVALGGDEINSPNKQLKELVDRTAYLKTRLEAQISDPLFIIYDVFILTLDGDKYKVYKVLKPPSSLGFTTLYKNITVEFARLSEQIVIGDDILAQLYVLDSATSGGDFVGHSGNLPPEWDPQFQQAVGTGFYSSHTFRVQTPVEQNVNEKNFVTVSQDDFTLPSDLVYYQGFEPYLKVETGKSAYLVIAPPSGYLSSTKFYARIWFQGVRLSAEQSALI